MKPITTLLLTFALSNLAAFAESNPAPAAATPPAPTAVPTAAAPAAPAAEAAAPAAAEADPVIMTAGDLKITKSEFEGALSTLPPQYRQFAMGPQKRRFAEDYLRIKLLAARAQQDGVDREPEVVKQIELSRNNVIAGAEARHIAATVAISPEELQQAYEAHKTEYERVKARHILIAPKGSPAAPKDGPQLTDEEAKAKAESLRAQLVAGADFAELAKKESDDKGSGANGGELGTFTHGRMVPEFDQAAFAAKVGEITPVVKTNFGYHIIQVEEHTVTPFEEVKANLERTLRQQQADAAVAKVVSATNPVFNDAYFGPAPTRPMLPPGLVPVSTPSSTPAAPAAAPSASAPAAKPAAPAPAAATPPPPAAPAD